MIRARLGLGTLAVFALAACEQPSARPRPVLLTLADLEAAAEDPATLLLPESGVPGGLPISDFVTKDASGGYHLTLRETWTEGYRSGYVTTELWSGFDEVWVQPMYVPASRSVTDGALMPVTDGRHWWPIFSVGPDSAFYSPFWELIYFEVPLGTAHDAYQSVRDVLDAGLPLIPVGPRAVALVPGDVGLPETLPAGTMVPHGDREIGGPRASAGFLDGREVKTLDFGADTFRWNEARVVEEIPIFVLLWRRPDGTLERLNVPTVAGTGPLYANRPVDAPNDHPRYGAYWRIYTVELPPTARIFAPDPLFEEFRKHVPAALLGTVPANVTAMAGGDPRFLDDWLGRVALNAVPVANHPNGCFDMYDYLTGDAKDYACQWLDSQPAIERAVVPEAIKKTDLVVTCPFVTYHDKAVLP